MASKTFQTCRKQSDGELGEMVSTLKKVVHYDIHFLLVGFYERLSWLVIPIKHIKGSIQQDFSRI